MARSRMPIAAGPAALATAVALALTPIALAGPASADSLRGGSHAHHDRGLTADRVTVTASATGAYTLAWPARAADRVSVYASTDARDPSRSGRLVAETRRDAVEITGLDPAKRWYFELVTDRGHRGVVVATTLVALQGATNTRDLGGIATSNGRTVRFGTVFRADAMNKLTDADVARFAGMGLRTAVDFRGTSEIAASGADRLPAGAIGVHAPALDESTGDLATMISAMLATGDNAGLAELLGDGKGYAMNVEGGASMATSAQSRKSFAETLRRLADPRQVPLLYHCTAGKDRTGMMTALLLTTLGVPRTTVTADYMASNDYRRAGNEATYAYLRSKGIDVELIRPVMEQSPAYVDAFLDTIQREYGSIDRYLAKGLGLDRHTVDRLRANLLVG